MSMPRLTDYRFLPLILILSLALNLWGNRWGAPNYWHPDEEITNDAIKMVGNRTLNPHEFRYGGLHYYIVAVGAVIPVFLQSLLFDPGTQWTEHQKARIIQIARTISALMSTLVVCFTFIIGTILFEKRVGYLAALLLTMSMSFVAIAHFATVDAPANFWYWLSCLFAVLIWKRGDRLWYVLASITAGFAIGTKTDRLIILFPLVLSHFLRGERLQVRKLLLFAILTPAGYLLANPTLFVSFFEFLDGLTRELFFNALRGEPGQTSYIPILAEMKSGLGLPLFVTAVAGLAYGLYNVARSKDRATILWLLATFVPYYLIIGSILGVAIPWYVPICFPSLIIFAAYGCVAAMNGLPRQYTVAMKAVIAGIVGYSFLNAVALVLQFSYDSRYQASQWIEQHVPASARIGMLPRGPVISREKYRIINFLPDEQHSDPHIGRWRDKLTRHRTYEKVRRGILTLEKWASHAFGFPVREHAYMGWFDHGAASYEKSSNQLPGIVGIRSLQPDYVVLTDYQPTTLSTLQSQSSGYRLVAPFHFTNRFGIQPSFIFVNLRVYIFQRDASAK